jgi:hypothetical protein
MRALIELLLMAQPGESCLDFSVSLERLDSGHIFEDESDSETGRAGRL